MQNDSGGRGAVSEPVTTITNHGGIQKMTLPEGFNQVRSASNLHNYAEYKWLASTVRICYEQSNEPLMDDDIAEMEKLLAQQIPGAKSMRRLNLYGEDESAPDDSGVYGALCQCFVFGGALVRDGACMDMDESTWELRQLGDKTVLLARLQFFSHTGNKSSRQALLVMPKAPDRNGTGYIWLEGTAQEINKHEAAFLNAIELGQFKSIA